MKIYVWLIAVLVMGYGTGILLESIAYGGDSKIQSLVKTGAFTNQWIPFGLGGGYLESTGYTTNNLLKSESLLFIKEGNLLVGDAILTNGHVDFTFDVENTGEFLANKITECIFQPTDNIPEATCLICNLTDINNVPVAQGQKDLSSVGLIAFQPEVLSIESLDPINDPWANNVDNIHGVSIKACLSVNGDEGCTPEFWRNNADDDDDDDDDDDVDFWPINPNTNLQFRPDDDLRRVFMLPPECPAFPSCFDFKLKGELEDEQNPTLLEALKAHGGEQNTLIRHAVAGLFNAADPNVMYAFSFATAKNALFNGFVTTSEQCDPPDDPSDCGGLKGGNFEATGEIFEEENEKLCPLRGCLCEKPTIFTVGYNGPTPITSVQVLEVGSATVSAGVAPFDRIITIDSRDFGRERLKSNTEYEIVSGGVTHSLSFHTSCSRDIFIGDIRSDGVVTLTVIGGFDELGNPTIPPAICAPGGGPDCVCTKPTIFKVQYVGPGPFPITVEIFKEVDDEEDDDPPLATLADITSSPHTITLNSITDLGKDTVKSNTVYHLTRTSDGATVNLGFHTSCSKPLFVGDTRMGGFTALSEDTVTLTVLGGFDSRNNPTIPASDCPRPPEDDDDDDHSEEGHVDSLSSSLHSGIPYDAKKEALENLIALQGQETYPTTTLDLSFAISQIQSSLTEIYWVNESHLSITFGEFVLSHSSQAIDRLLLITTLSAEPQTFKVSVQNVINLLVRADTNLAQTSLDDVIACDGKTPKVSKHITNAQQKLNEALADQNLENYSEAIIKLYVAWLEAFLASESCPDGYWTQFEGFQVVKRL